jgi:hypothetical protein
MEPERIPKQLIEGIYTERNKIDWTPEVALEGKISLTGERSRSICQNADNDDEDRVLMN